MLTFLKDLFDPNQKAIKSVEPIVEEIIALEEKYKETPLEKMKSRVEEMRTEITPLITELPEEARTSLTATKAIEFQQREDEIKAKLQEFVPEMFAMLKEVNRRKFKRPHYQVQLIAAVILAKGNNLVELKTGEGKTQVFHLPAALYGITGRGSHVITVNDYLARRDGEYAGHALDDLGISVGIITPEASYKFVPDRDLEKVKGSEAVAARNEIDELLIANMKGINLIECSKKEAYAQDVLYGTNNEFGFDYLRDNMAGEPEQRVQRELYYCIIDEADSILIDEARTPLIISAPAEASNQLYQQFAQVSKKLKQEKHFTVDEKARSVTLTEEGVDYVEKMLNVKNLWEDYQLAHHLENALKAEVLFEKDNEYIIRNGEVLIVDDFTGRVLPGRRYSEGLHQAIEAKEGVEIKRESKTMATITFQNFFKLYKVLGGGSGTIMTEAEEFFKIYNLDSYAVPTNKPVIREDKVDVVYKNQESKFKAVAAEISSINKTGQPILVGTASIEDSETVSRLLDKQGIEHEVLNAKFHEREAQIVSKAGEKSAVTVATNMAGRGTDIPLSKEVIELGGLYVIGTQRHEARRIDNQLRGRSGRQGDPGATQFFIALDDEIMRIQGGEMVSRIMTATKVPDDLPIESRLIGRTIESAQKKMEGHNFDIRKRLVDYDNVMNQQREIFYTKRFKIIDLVKQAQENKNENKKDNSSTKESTDQKEALERIKTELSELVLKEVEDIVNRHYFEQRDDSADLNQAISEFFGLADKESMVSALRHVFPKIKSPDGKGLNAELGGQDIEVVKEKFIAIITKISTEKFTEFENDLPQIYKILYLQTMDQLWTDHLNEMGDLREGIGLRGYAQRDPLVEYKNEAFDMFENFMSRINSQVAKRILKVQRVAQRAPIQPARNLSTNQDQIEDVLTGDREMQTEIAARISKQAAKKGPVQPKVKAKEPGRNDPCPCGSGLKYKKCGLINAPQHRV